MTAPSTPHRLSSTQLQWAARPVMVGRPAGELAVGEQIGRLVGLDVELGKPTAWAELSAGEQPLGQFEMIADVEELDRIRMIFGKFHKRMGPRGDDPAVEFQGLADRTR